MAKTSFPNVFCRSRLGAGEIESNVGAEVESASAEVAVEPGFAQTMAHGARKDCSEQTLEIAGKLYVDNMNSFRESPIITYSKTPKVEKYAVIAK